MLDFVTQSLLKSLLPRISGWGRNRHSTDVFSLFEQNSPQLLTTVIWNYSPQLFTSQVPAPSRLFSVFILISQEANAFRNKHKSKVASMEAALKRSSCSVSSGSSPAKSIKQEGKLKIPFEIGFAEKSLSCGYSWSIFNQITCWNFRTANSESKIFFRHQIPAIPSCF